MALALAVRDALQVGTLYLEESRHHVSFWNLVHGPAVWEQEREAAYSKLSLPIEATTVIDRLLRTIRSRSGSQPPSCVDLL